MESSPAQAQTCHFPATGKQDSGPKRPLSARVELQYPELVQQLVVGDNGDEALSAVVRAVWALLLRCYTGLDHVCYGIVLADLAGHCRGGLESIVKLTAGIVAEGCS